jgi:hypothetical protein
MSYKWGLIGYTCYGCPDHQSAQTRVEHSLEGIRTIDNCTRGYRTVSSIGNDRDEIERGSHCDD